MTRSRRFGKVHEGGRGYQCAGVRDPAGQVVGKGHPVRKQSIQYSSPLDALVVIAKRLSTYENRQQMDSEEFFDRYSKGQLPDDALFVEWANDYHHYLALRREIEKRLQHAA